MTFGVVVATESLAFGEVEALPTCFIGSAEIEDVEKTELSSARVLGPA
jgi:hypothetical protein